MKTRALIDGRLGKVKGHATFDVFNSAPEASLRRVADGSFGDVATAVATAGCTFDIRDGATNRSVPGECVAVGWREL